MQRAQNMSHLVQKRLDQEFSSTSPNCVARFTVKHITIYVYKSNFQHTMIPCLSVTKLCFESHFSHFFPLTIFVVLYIISEPFAPLEMKDCDEKMVKYTRFVASAINPKQNGFRRRQPSLPTFLFESVNLVLVSN